jgi:hypothetical protein
MSAVLAMLGLIATRLALTQLTTEFTLRGCDSYVLNNIQIIQR